MINKIIMIHHRKKLQRKIRKQLRKNKLWHLDSNIEELKTKLKFTIVRVGVSPKYKTISIKKEDLDDFKNHLESDFDEIKDLY